MQERIKGKGIESRTLLYRAMLSHTYPYLRTLCNVLTPPTGKLDGLIRDHVSLANSRRNSPKSGEETVNERLHISALQRWQLEQVQHDAPADKDIDPIPYRPPNLTAVIKQAQTQPSATIPVVG